MSLSFIGALTVVVLLVLLACRRSASLRAAIKAPPLVEHPSPNFSDRGSDSVSFLILHYTAMNTAQEALDKLCDPKSKVSSHYLVAEDGTIYRLVAENKSAYHAGVSFWNGASNLNPKSIGIEIANQGDRPFPPKQMAAVTALCQWIMSRHSIPQQNVLAHSDIAPDRKIDPGWFFDWKALAANGVGVFPAPTAQDYDRVKDWKLVDVRNALNAYGYRKDLELPLVVAAFQRHFRQEVASNTDQVGAMDKEACARLACLLRTRR